MSMTCCVFSAFAVEPARPAPPPPPPAPPVKATAPTPAPTVLEKPWGKLTLDHGRAWELHKTTITVGSATSCDVVLPDATVAPEHFRMTFANGNAAVEDLGSKFGTLVAGAAVKRGKPFKVVNAVEIDPGAATLHFEFLARGDVGPSQPRTTRKETPKLKVVLPVQKK